MELASIVTPKGPATFFVPQTDNLHSIYDLYHALVDESEWEAQPFQWLSVYSQAARWGEDLVRSLPGGMVGRAVACGKKESLLMVAARGAFKNMNKTWLQKLMKYLGVASESQQLYNILEAIIRHIFEKAGEDLTEEDLLQVMSTRM
eukprot:7914631-Lingulodinium_polyedra.AAC.1